MGMYCEVYAAPDKAVKQLLADPEQVDCLFDAETGLSVHLEKAWHGLHYLLTGSAWEGDSLRGFLLLGGEPLGDEEFGEGGARLVRPDAVQQLNSELTQISDDQLWSRFDADQMTAQHIYPGVWDEPEEELRDEYLTYFRELKELVRQASAGQMGLVISLG